MYIHMIKKKTFFVQQLPNFFVYNNNYLVLKSEVQ